MYATIVQLNVSTGHTHRICVERLIEGGMMKAIRSSLLFPYYIRSHKKHNQLNRITM